jgi:hypothetical protein
MCFFKGRIPVLHSILITLLFYNLMQHTITEAMVLGRNLDCGESINY